MTDNEFWSLIERAKEHEEEQGQWLIEELSGKNIEEIVAYELIQLRKLEQSYTPALWGAAYVIMGGCSDDCFDYFRGWLIAQGEQVFNIVLTDPEYLNDYIPDYYMEEDLAPQFEEMLSIASDAYTYKKTERFDYNDELNKEFLDYLEAKGYVFKTPYIEFDWKEDDLPSRYPCLWSRFGDTPLL